MTSQLLKKQISVLEYGSNISYIFEDPGCFSPGDYKILSSLSMPSLVQCLETRLNGRIMLIYLTRGYRSFRNVIDDAGKDGMLAAAAGLLKSICSIEKNGFLSCINLDLSFDHIFLDTGTNAVKLVCLPLNSGLYSDQPQFEKVLRSSLTKAMMDRGFFTGPHCQGFLSALQNIRLSLKDILLMTERGNEILTLTQPGSEEAVFVIDSDSYVIGRSAQEADGVVNGDQAIGRRHCRMIRKNGSFMIEDLGSINGTFINGKALSANCPAAVKDRDIVRIADRDFRVRIRPDRDMDLTRIRSGEK